MYEDSFNRIEQKYLMSKEVYLRFYNDIKDYLIEDKYYESHISNLFFDTDKDDLLNKSISKPKYKHKVRLRSYKEICNDEDEVFLEVKMKYKQHVGKRRVKLLYREFMRYLNTGFYVESQKMKELDYLFKYYHLKPSYYMYYDRLSYKCKEDPTLRITFDYNLRTRRDHLSLDYGSEGINYFDDEMYILEIKYHDALPLWLVRKLSEYKLYRRAFSKIGKAYEKEMEMRNKEC